MVDAVRHGTEEGVIRVVIDFDPHTTALQVTAQDSQKPGVVMPPAAVFGVVNAAYLTMLTQTIREEIRGEDQKRIVEADGDILRRLPKPPET